MLGVSPSTLRAWERRFGFPAPRRSPGGHRQYDLADVEALRHGLQATGDVSSAVAVARERGAGPASPLRLRGALTAFDEPAADRLLEESLAVRSVERTVEEVLLPGVGAVGAAREAGAPEAAFAWRWAMGWLAAQLRTAPPASRPDAVLVLDATGPLALDGLAVAALDLALRRAGVRTLTLGAALDPARLGRAVTAVRPALLVLAGAPTELDAVARLVHAARRAGGPVAVHAFRAAPGASTVPRLPDEPLAARAATLAVLDRGGVLASRSGAGA